MQRYLATVAFVLLSNQAHSGQSHQQGSLENCLTAVTEIRAGDFIKVEYLSFTDEGKSAFEIEIRDTDGRNWEFECDAGSGNIIEIEQEVDSADDPLFKRRMKVSEAEARDIALSLYPGTIKEVEYEIEANGQASYEFDIQDKYGIEFKVEVDASSGDIVEFQMEKWQIGEQPAAR